MCGEDVARGEEVARGEVTLVKEEDPLGMGMNVLLLTEGERNCGVVVATVGVVGKGDLSSVQVRMLA